MLKINNSGQSIRLPKPANKCCTARYQPARPAVFLSIIPVIVDIAEWTNGMHGLYDRSMMLVPRGPFGGARFTEAPLRG